VRHHLDEFDDERRWLRPPPRHRRRLLLGLPLVAALTVVSLAFGERSFGGRSEVLEPAHEIPAAPTPPSSRRWRLDAGRWWPGAALR
jgi:hypothetical protein